MAFVPGAWQELLKKHSAMLPGTVNNDINPYYEGPPLANTISIQYDFETDAYKVAFSQGFYILITKELAVETPAAKLFDMISYISKASIPQGCNVIQLKASPAASGLNLELHWPNKPQTKVQPKKPEDSSADKTLPYLYGGLFTSKVIEQIKPEPKVNALHVYDLGDGMLVPCELAYEIVIWLKNTSTSWGMSKEMIEDDMYAKPAEVIGKAWAKQDAGLWKVWASQYLVSPDEFFILNKSASKSMAQVLAELQSVKIPKKPKQVTKESLEYFKKILGTPKIPKF